MALPNFQFFYRVANIHRLAYWVHFHLELLRPAWVSMEASTCSPVSLLAILSAALTFASYIPKGHPLLSHSLQIWTRFRKSFGFHAPSLCSPIAANIFFVPSCSFQFWHNKCLNCLENLFINDCFVSFSHLTDKFDISRT